LSGFILFIFKLFFLRGSLSRDYGNFDKSAENKVELHSALDLLEQANESKNNQAANRESKEDNTSKWDKFLNFLNPFKCG